MSYGYPSFPGEGEFGLLTQCEPQSRITILDNLKPSPGDNFVIATKTLKNGSF
jgi:hypothetical protein